MPPRGERLTALRQIAYIEAHQRSQTVSLPPLVEPAAELTIDEVRRYKPAPEPYYHVASRPQPSSEHSMRQRQRIATNRRSPAAATAFRCTGRLPP